MRALAVGASQAHAEFGAAFTLLRQEREEHHTPAGAVPRFTYGLCRQDSN